MRLICNRTQNDAIWVLIALFLTNQIAGNTIDFKMNVITSIIFPGLPYSELLEKANLTLLSDRRRQACLKLFNQIKRTLRTSCQFCSQLGLPLPMTYVIYATFEAHIIKTDRFLKTFIPSCIKEFS